MIIKEVRTDGKMYKIAIFINESGKYQYVNLTKEKICPCEFDSYGEAFADLVKYIREGKIKALRFEDGFYENSK